MRITGMENGIHLIGGHCVKCGVYSFPQRQVCSNCYHDQVNEVALSNTGTVYSYTVVRVRPPEGFPLPYAIGYVLLDREQVVVPALFTGSEEEMTALAIGTSVVLHENTAGHIADYVFAINPADLEG